jgi:N-glycosylase/DNA lyase
MTVVPLQRQLTLDEVVRAIHKKFADAIDSEGRSIRCRIAAGQMLIALRERIESGEAGKGIEWWRWYESKFVRSRRDAEKVMALARAEDPEAAADEEREINRQAKRRERATSDVSRSNDDEEQPEDGDVVDQAFRLVVSMNAEQKERFIARIKEHFRW